MNGDPLPSFSLDRGAVKIRSNKADYKKKKHDNVICGGSVFAEIEGQLYRMLGPRGFCRHKEIILLCLPS